MIQNRKKFNELYKGVFNKEKSSSLITDENDYKSLNKLPKNNLISNLNRKPLTDITTMNNINNKSNIPNVSREINEIMLINNKKPRLNPSFNSNNERSLLYNSNINSNINKEQVFNISLNDIKPIKNIKPYEYFKEKRNNLIEFFTNFDNTIEINQFLRMDVIDNALNNTINNNSINSGKVDLNNDEF